MCQVRSADAMEFFAHRAGRWQSRRVTHHLAFRRAESGESEIEMEVLQADDEKIKKLCSMHQVDESLASGGCRVSWQATMAWDQEGENHTGETVFALVPDKDNVRAGRMLRDRGYAEIVPVAGQYELTDDDQLTLTTPYEGGAVEEVFAFDGVDICNRISSVRRFGGIATATFSTERRIGSTMVVDEDDDDDADDLLESMLFGASSSSPGRKPLTSSFMSASKSRFAKAAAQRAASGAPSANSAFGSGFSGAAQPADINSVPGETASKASSVDDAPKDRVSLAADRAGIDLSKVPPSMREEFLKSLEKDASGS